jgi:hypothetical protein
MIGSAILFSLSTTTVAHVMNRLSDIQIYCWITLQPLPTRLIIKYAYLLGYYTALMLVETEMYLILGTLSTENNQGITFFVIQDRRRRRRRHPTG